MPTAPAGMKYQEIWQAYSAGKPIEFTQDIGVERLRRYSCRDYPGWNMTIPDVLRMDRFLKEFREFEESGWFAQSDASFTCPKTIWAAALPPRPTWPTMTWR